MTVSFYVGCMVLFGKDNIEYLTVTKVTSWHVDVALSAAK